MILEEGPPAMTYDIDYRFRLALDPSALTTITTTLHAIGQALDDARNAGADPENDPGIALLASHLGRIATATVDEPPCPRHLQLRDLCAKRVNELSNAPTFIILARRGLGADTNEERKFVAEIRERLGALSLELNDGRTRVTRQRPDFLGRCDVTMDSDHAHVRVTTTLPNPGHEIEFWRNDQRPGRHRSADIAELADARQLAARIRRELFLAPMLQPALI